MFSIIKLRRGPSAEWAIDNPLLAAGEPGLELDTGRFKIGDGSRPWSALPYYVNVDAISEQIAAAIAALPGGGNGAEGMIGDLSALTTIEKDTVVGAINEVNTPPIPLTLLYDNAKAG